MLKIKRDVLRFHLEDIERRPPKLYRDGNKLCEWLEIRVDGFSTTGMEVETVISIWEACFFEPICRLEVLKRKSLVRIQKSGFYEVDTLWIHDQLRDMGRRIAYNQRPENPNYHSGLWSYDNIMKGCKGNEIVEAIVSRYSFNNFEGLKNACLRIEDFEKMHELRLLEINGAILKGNFQCLPSRLRWLGWQLCRLEKLPADFCHEELVALDLRGGSFQQAWNKWPEDKLLQRLKILDLSFCRQLSVSPDFSGFPQLEKLDLSYCLELVDLHESIGKLKQLVFLNLDFCKKLRKLPDDICRLSSLREFLLEFCRSLEQLPYNIGRLSSLQKLKLGDSDSLKELPSSISNLRESLTELSLDGTSIEELPDDIVLFKKLEVLRLCYNFKLRCLPKSMETMTSLRELDLYGCHSLPCTPKLPSNLIRFRFWRFEFDNLQQCKGNLKSVWKFIDLETCRVMVEKFRGFAETSRIGDEFNELISNLDRSCCVVTVPDLSTLSEVQQETIILRDINTERRRQIWVPLRQQTAEKGCKCTLDISYPSSCFCSCSWVRGSRYFLIPDDDHELSSSSSSSSSRLVLHVSLGVYHIEDHRYELLEGPQSCICVDIEACIYSKDENTGYKICLEIGGTIKSNRPGGHIEFIHEFEGLDWFGVPLERGDTIEVQLLNPNPTFHAHNKVYAFNQMGYSLRAVNLFLIKEERSKLDDDQCHSSHGDHDRFLQIVRLPPRTTEDEDISEPHSEDEDISESNSEEEEEMTHETGEMQHRITQHEGDDDNDGDHRTEFCCSPLYFLVRNLFFAAT